MPHKFIGAALIVALTAYCAIGAQSITGTNNGDNLTILSGGAVEFRSGATLDVQAGATFHVGKTDSVPATPAEGDIYWDDSENMLKVYTGASWTALAGGTFTGGSITSDVTLDNGVDILSTTTTAHTNSIQARDIDGTAYVDILRWTNGDTAAMVLGAPTVQFSLDSTGLDVSTAGAVTAFGLTSSGAAASLNANSNFNVNINTGTSTGTTTIGGGLSSLAIDTSAWDVSGAGAMSGITTLSLSGDISVANGKGLKSSTTTGQTAGLYGYDVNGTAYVGAVVITNGDTPAVVLGNANGTTAVSSADWAIGTTGDMTGIGAITADGTFTLNNNATIYSNEAVTLTHGTNGAADDLTIALTGATDSSIVVSSAGTGADAISLAATAGTIKAAGDKIDLDSAGDLDIVVTSSEAGEDLLISQVGANDSSITIVAEGTGADAIGLSAAAGTVKILGDILDMDSTGDFNITVTSSGDGEDLLLSQVGANDSSITLAAAGTGTDAIGIQASAGGVDIDAATAKDVAIDGGQVLITSKDNATSAIALTANQGTAETIVVTNTQGTSAGAITLTATAGGITFTSSAGVATGDPITGDGTAALGGFLKTVTNDADNRTLTAAESGTVLTSAGAADPDVFTLPAAAAGLEYTFVVMAAQELRILPVGNDVINDGGTAGEAAEYFTANAVGETMHIIGVDATNWIVISKTGTWTQQNP